MRWVQAESGDYRGIPPSRRSGHSSVKVGSSLLVIFGGLVDKIFLQDLAVLDIDTQIWFQPGGTVAGADVAGPGPRAFHVAVASHGHMFVFGGRSGRKRLGDFWVLDIDTWQWSELVGYGDLPPARDFAAGASYGDGKLVIYGGWDGSKWLSDVFVLDTISLEWRQLTIIGPIPAPRCGHSLIMVEKRMLIFGGRGAGGPILGDLWALKGLFDEEGESASWTQLKLPGPAPTPRCGHSITSGGSQLFVFGGHGTAGWLTRYDVYYNDVFNLNRASVHWKRLVVTGESPPPRAYHTMTRVHGRYLLFGGYDGKTIHGDMWWLVSEDDPIGSRALLTRQPKRKILSANLDGVGSQKVHEDGQDGLLTTNIEMIGSVALSPFRELRHRLGLPFHNRNPSTADQHQDEFVSSLHLHVHQNQGVRCKAPYELQSNTSPTAIRLREVESILRDYQGIVSSLNKSKLGACMERGFYHLTDVKLMRLEEVAMLLEEYKAFK